MPPLDFLQHITILNDKATAPALASIDRPKIDIKLLETYARHWYARGWLPRPPKTQPPLSPAAQNMKDWPLSGRVVSLPTFKSDNLS